MSLTKTADHIINGLLLLAIGVFAVALLLYGANLLNIRLPLAPNLIPKSLFATLVPPLTVLTVYELVHLAVAVQAPLVQFIRTLFQVVSVTILSDLMKDLSKLPLRGPSVAQLTEPGMLLAAAFLLYLLIEFLERLERRHVRSSKPKMTPRLAPYRNVFAWGLLAYVVGFAAYNAVGLLTSIPHVGFTDEFLRLIFSGFVIVNVFILLIALFFVKTYETLFEFFALVLASVMVLYAVPLATPPKLTIVFAALIFSIATLSLSGFARNNSPTGGSEI